MAEAIARRQEWGGKLNLPAALEGQALKGYRAVLRAIADSATPRDSPVKPETASARSDTDSGIR